MKLKKLLTVLLTLAMASSVMSGCTKSVGNQSDGAENSDKVKEYTAFFAVPGNEINDDNEIQQKIAEVTGAKVKETWLTGQTAEEAVGTLIAGGEYPDLIDGSDGTAQLYDAGALLPLDDYIEKNENLKNLWSKSEWDKVRQDDGHIYWIPQFGNVYDHDMKPAPDEAFWIQTRVLKWANYPDIKTLDEYFQLLEDYMAANPIMKNGTKNVPYTILCDDWRYFCLENPPQFLAGFPNDGSVIVDPKTKKIVDYNTTDEAVAYFKKLNEEYQKGIIDPEAFTQSFDEYIAKLSSGRVLGMVDQWWQFLDARDSLKQQKLNEEGCNYVPLALTVDEGVTANYNVEQAINPANGVGVSVSCEDPEGVMKFLNDILSPEVRILRGWGVEDVDYQVGEDGFFVRTDEQWMQVADSSYKASHLCTYSYLPNYVGVLADKKNASDPAEQPTEFLKSLPSDVQECLAAYDSKTYLEMMDPADEVPGPWFPMYSKSNTMTTATDGGTAWAKMGEIKHQYLPKVVMSDDFSSTWDEYMKVYEGCNPDAFLKEMQEELEKRIENAAKYAE